MVNINTARAFMYCLIAYTLHNSRGHYLHGIQSGWIFNAANRYLHCKVLRKERNHSNEDILSLSRRWTALLGWVWGFLLVHVMRLVRIVFYKMCTWYLLFCLLHKKRRNIFWLRAANYLPNFSVGISCNIKEV